MEFGRLTIAPHGNSLMRLYPGRLLAASNRTCQTGHALRARSSLCDRSFPWEHEQYDMNEWHCLHLNESVTAMIISDRNRFLVRLREPQGDAHHSIEFYRWTLKDAMKAADRLVQAYYPHACSDSGCGEWWKL